MDYSSLKNISAYTASLTNFLGKGSNDYFSAVSQNIINNITKTGTATAAADSYTSVNIKLSDEAQKLLDAGTTDSSGKSTVTGVQKTGQNFMLSFFDQAGVDFSKLSTQSLELLEGLQDVIGGSAATNRDLTTDIAEEKYNSNRKVFTLSGTGSRLRLAIEYGTDGKPQKLSVTDISGGQVETADITLQSKDGKLATMTIERTQRNYINGHMVMLDPIEPMTTDLYPKA